MVPYIHYIPEIYLLMSISENFVSTVLWFDLLNYSLWKVSLFFSESPCLHWISLKLLNFLLEFKIVSVISIIYSFRSYLVVLTIGKTKQNNEPSNYSKFCFTYWRTVIFVWILLPWIFHISCVSVLWFVYLLEWT